MEDTSGSSTWVYDSRGRLVTETLAITGVGSYTTRWMYNSADQLTGMTYPSGEHVSTLYYPQGWVSEVDSDYWMIYASQAKYDAGGRLLERTLGNGVKTSNTYNPWNEQGGRLESTSSVTSQAPMVTRQHLAYSYDANGNISEIQDSVASETLNYSYDVLDRLTGVSGAYSQSYGYDATTGNLASKAGQTLTYTDANHPHAATGMGSNVYAYDANGNMVSRQIVSGTYTLSYDAESRLVGISGGGMSAAYTYNGDGKRVKAIVSTGSDIKTTAYIGDYFEVSVGDPKPVTAHTPVDCSITTCVYLPLVISSSPTIPAGHAWTSYYTAGGSRVAMRVKSNQDGVEDGIFYFLTDHLGSTAITLDPTGNLVSELRYSAWGETRTSTGVTPTQRRYTGQLEAEAGLYFYNARFYDNTLGRFISADTIIPEAIQGTQAWDRFAYSNNNPILHSDPSGHCVGPLLVVCIAVASFVADNVGIITSIALTGAILSFIGPSNPDPELVNNPVASQEALVSSAYQALGWLTIGEAALQVSSMAPPKPTYCRYCSKAEVEAIKETGLLRGGRPGPTYFTTDDYQTIEKSQTSLALPYPPEVKIEFSIVNSPNIYGPSIVEPKYGQVGGGIQYWSTDPIRVIIHSIQNLLAE